MAQTTNMSFFGELIETQRKADAGSRTGKLDAWHSNIDNLGTLLTLAIAAV